MNPLYRKALLSPRLTSESGCRAPEPECRRHHREFASGNPGGLLPAARPTALTLVTYDQRTIPALLHRWAQSDESHAGVIFVDERTVAPNDFPRLARSLIRFWDLHRDLDWTNRLAFLPQLSHFAGFAAANRFRFSERIPKVFTTRAGQHGQQALGGRPKSAAY